MKTVLVTGGAGYIGSHACKGLKAAGYTPVTLDDFSTGWNDAVKFGPCITGTLSDRALLARIFAEHAIDAVMHFAAASLVGESMKDPGKYWRNNVCGTLNLVEAAVAAGCLDMVFSSTCAVYGQQDGVVLDESSSIMPLNAYGKSKYAIESMLQDFNISHGLRSIIFRYFNVAGADPEAEVGEYHQPETHLIPVILETLRGERPALTLFGTDYDTPDGTCIRDYVHVMDLVDAHILGLRHLTQQKKSDIFCLGTGTGFSVRDVISACERIAGGTVPVEEGPRREGDAEKLVSGGSWAADILGWHPARSTLDQMVGDALNWQRTGGYT